MIQAHGHLKENEGIVSDQLAALARVVSMALVVAKLAMWLPRLLERANFLGDGRMEALSTHGHAQDLDIVVGRHF